MAKVYAVIEGDCDDTEDILGIYSTLAGAKEVFKRKCNICPEGTCRCCHIREIPLDCNVDIDDSNNPVYMLLENTFIKYNAEGGFNRYYTGTLKQFYENSETYHSYSAELLFTHLHS